MGDDKGKKRETDWEKGQGIERGRENARERNENGKGNMA